MAHVALTIRLSVTARQFCQPPGQPAPAFAANTATIVLLQLLVLQRIEGRRRTRVILVLSAIWAASGAQPGVTPHDAANSCPG